MSLVNYKTLPIPIPTWLRPPRETCCPQHRSPSAEKVSPSPSLSPLRRASSARRQCRPRGYSILSVDRHDLLALCHVSFNGKRKKEESKKNTAKGSHKEGAESDPLCATTSVAEGWIAIVRAHTFNMASS